MIYQNIIIIYLFQVMTISKQHWTEYTLYFFIIMYIFHFYVNVCMILPAIYMIYACTLFARPRPDLRSVFYLILIKSSFLRKRAQDSWAIYFIMTLSLFFGVGGREAGSFFWGRIFFFVCGRQKRLTAPEELPGRDLFLCASFERAQDSGRLPGGCREAETCAGSWPGGRLKAAHGFRQQQMITRA